MNQLIENKNEQKSVHVPKSEITFVLWDKLNQTYGVQKNQILLLVLRFLNLELMFYLYIYVSSERKRKTIKKANIAN